MKIECWKQEALGQATCWAGQVEKSLAISHCPRQPELPKIEQADPPTALVSYYECKRAVTSRNEWCDPHH